jgi:hypothetical protein
MISKNKFITSAKAIKTVANNKQLVTIVLLCDSPGYRMKSYGPASLITIHGKKLIDIQIEIIKKVFTNYEIIVCVGFDSEKICKHIRQKYKNSNIRIVENQNFHLSNSCESARLSLNNTTNDKILLCDGSLYFVEDTIGKINFSESSIFTEKHKNENLEVGANINEYNYVEHFSFGANTCWSEICFLHNYETIECLRKILASFDKTKFVFEALNELIQTKYNLRNIINDQNIYKINNLKTYHKLKEEI